MKNLIKFISSTIIVVLFTVIALASGNSDKNWEPNNKELFCGETFENSRNLKEIDMEIKASTVLNADGTYTSKNGWNAGESSKQDYRNTVGRSSDEEHNFKGTWEIIQPTETMKGDGSLDKYKPTYIKYSCNQRKGGYAYVVCMNNYLYLQTIDQNGRDIFTDDEANFGMFSGLEYTDIESITK